jgi:hypothetical protein
LSSSPTFPGQNPFAVGAEGVMMAVEVMTARQLTSCAALVCY